MKMERRMRRGRENERENMNIQFHGGSALKVEI